MIRVEWENIDTWLHRLTPQRATRFLEVLALELGEEGAAAMRENTPVRTGRLRETAHYVRGPGYVDIIEGGREAPYAVYVDQGTRPHVILPRRASALRFETAEGVVFARRVKHPGTVPAHIVRRTAEALRLMLRDIVRRGLGVFV